ncbi:MAG: chemotaxis protein CheA [Myxococcales bacterium]|nr:chemotaxis protein CheA [Myxococcales bacterium]
MAIDEDNIEIIEEFVAESADNIGEVEAILIEMESGTCEADDETLNLIFRAFHSVKGTAGFLELNNVVHVTHLAESLLDMLRKGEMTLQPSHVSVFLRGLDCVNRALEEVGSEGTDTCIEELSQTVGMALQEEMDARGVDDQGAIGDDESGDDAAQDVGALAALDLTAPLDDGQPIDEAEEAQPTEAPVPSEAPRNTSNADEYDILGGDVDEEAEMLAEFVTDSLELLDSVDASLAAARDGLVSKELADDGLRALHTIKGNCGFLGFFELGDLCHSTETGLGRLVTGESANLDPVFAAVDALRVGVADLGQGGEGRVPNLKALRSDLEHIGDMPLATAPTEAPPVAEPPMASPVLEAAEPEAAEPEEVSAIEAVVDEIPEPTITLVPEETPVPLAPVPSATAKTDGSKSAPKQSIRVDTTKLDELMNLVGELIIAENMVSHNEDLEGHEFENFHKAALHLNRITRSLQDLTMSVRMVPIRPTFRKMLRVARDVARKQTKDVELVLSGEETEVDRSVVEAIGDPLVHLLRNAVDHGVEDADTRLALGKPAKGQLNLSAHHEAGEVWIVLADDGKGLDRERILAKAIDKGVVDSGDGLTDNEVYQLITEPGFSTADQLSDISGRGVGMDVVKRNIEKLRGRLDISSQLGYGTTFTLRIPLTLAIVEGMQVRVGLHSYTIPLFAIRESVAVEDMAVSSLTDGNEVLELRGEFIPVLRMSNLHSIEAHATTWEEGVLVIVSDAGFTMALFVDEVVGQRQTVVKPLPGYLGTMQGLAGCSILSTGKISLVVDVQTLTERVRLAA